MSAGRISPLGAPQERRPPQELNRKKVNSSESTFLNSGAQERVNDDRSIASQHHERRLAEVHSTDK